MATLLLIHGGLWEDTGADWFWGRPGVIAGLEKRGFTVVAPDRLRQASSWADEAAHVASAVRGAVAAALPARPVTVVGGSFGCAVAARLALGFPALAERLLLACAGRPQRPVPGHPVPRRAGPARRAAPCPRFAAGHGYAAKRV